MNKDALKELDLLLQDYEDAERDFYLQSKSSLESGLTYEIEKIILSDKQEEFKPLNLIKPFFTLFYTNDTLFYKAKYKKRKILTSFRGNLQNIPLCMDDDIEFQILQSGKIVFAYEGVLNNLINDFAVVLDPLCSVEFKIKLIKSNDSRTYLEKELDSHAFINNILESFKRYCQSSRFVVSKSKQTQVNSWFCDKLNLKNFDIMLINMSHLKILSKDILILEKIITSLRYGRLSLYDTKEISQYKELMLENIKNLENSKLIFKNTIVTLNFKKVLN